MSSIFFIYQKSARGGWWDGGGSPDPPNVATKKKNAPICVPFYAGLKPFLQKCWQRW